MKHTISVLVENKFGVLARVAGLFSARGFNIASLTVGETEDPTISRMTIVVDAADERILEQIKKQLHKLIDVITLVDLTKREFIERELILVKVDMRGKNKDAVKSLEKKFPLTVLEIKAGQAIVQIVADARQVAHLIPELKLLGAKELTRAGKVAIAKG
jgi:acetolactate synthase I/III small subunit